MGRPPTQLRGQLVATGLVVGGVLGPIGRLGLFEDRLDLGFEGSLALDDPAVAHRLVPGGVRLQLRAVDGDPPGLDHAGRLADGEDVEEALPKDWAA